MIEKKIRQLLFWCMRSITQYCLDALTHQLELRPLPIKAMWVFLVNRDDEDFSDFQKDGLKWLWFGGKILH